MDDSTGRAAQGAERLSDGPRVTQQVGRPAGHFDVVSGALSTTPCCWREEMPGAGESTAGVGASPPILNSSSSCLPSACPSACGFLGGRVFFRLESGGSVVTTGGEGSSLPKTHGRQERRAGSYRSDSAHTAHSPHPLPAMRCPRASEHRRATVHPVAPERPAGASARGLRLLLSLCPVPREGPAGSVAEIRFVPVSLVSRAPGRTAGARSRLAPSRL